MATAKKPLKKKKSTTTGGKSAIRARVNHEIVVDCFSRYYEAYDIAYNQNSVKFGKAKLIVETVNGDVYVRDTECGETQFKIPKATFAALVDEVNKKVEISK